MNATKKLYDAGQSLWLDNITRELLTSGALKRYIDELHGDRSHVQPYDIRPCDQKQRLLHAAIRERLKAGKSGEDLFFEIALEDITQAADLFRPIHERTAHVDGWVSLEVSPVLAHDTKTTIAEAKDLHRARGSSQPLHQDSRHEGGAACDRGDDLRRHSGQRDAAIFARALSCRGGRISSRGRTPDCCGPESQCRFGCIAVHQSMGCCGCGQDTRRAERQARDCNRRARYKAYSDLLVYLDRGAPSTRAPDRSGCCSQAPVRRTRRLRHAVCKGLAAPLTVNTMPENTLKAFAAHGDLGSLMSADGGDCEAVLAAFGKAGVDIETSRREAAGRRREVVCRVLERTPRGDRLQERGARKRCLSPGPE